MPVPVAPTTAVLGQPASSGAQFNALAARNAYLIGGMPLFIGRQATVQAIPTTVWTAVTFDASDSDRDNGHSNTVNNSQYVAQTAGWYDVQAAGAFSNATSGRRGIRLQTNGGASNGSEVSITAGSTNPTTLQTTALVYLSVGTYLEAALYQDSGAAVNTYINSQATCALRARWVST